MESEKLIKIMDSRIQNLQESLNIMKTEGHIQKVKNRIEEVEFLKSLFNCCEIQEERELKILGLQEEEDSSDYFNFNMNEQKKTLEESKKALNILQEEYKNLQEEQKAQEEGLIFEGLKFYNSGTDFKAYIKTIQKNFIKMDYIRFESLNDRRTYLMSFKEFLKMYNTEKEKEGQNLQEGLK